MSNREHEWVHKAEVKKAVKQTMKTMGPAVGTAILATILGFVALFISPVPMIQEFGKMLTVGVLISFFAGVFLLIPILYLRDRNVSEEDSSNSRQHSHAKPSKLEGRLKQFAAFTIRFRWILLLLALAVTSWGVWADQRVGVQTDVETFMPQDTKELHDIHKLRDVLGSTDQVTILYEGDNLLSADSIQRVDRMTESLKQQYPDVIVSSKSLPSVLRLTNNGELPTDIVKTVEEMPENQTKMFINQDHTKGTITVGIKHLEAQELKQFINDLKESLSKNQPADMRITVTGKSVLDVEMLDALTSGRNEMTLLGMGLVFLGLLVVYRHPVKAFVPLLPISLIVGWSGAAMYLLNLKYTPLTATLGALIVGIGTEFTILLMERFYEERKQGHDPKNAMIIAVGKIGKAVIASGLTVVGGFSALLVSDFLILKDFGLMTVINMLLALFSTLVVMPPLLVMLDRFVKTSVPEKQKSGYKVAVETKS